MRTILPAAVLAALVALPSAALAQDEAEGDENETPSGSSGWGSDPADSETSDKGPFAPKGKTGEVKEVAEVKEEEEEVKAVPRKPINGLLDVFAIFGAPPDPQRPVSDGKVSAYGFVLGGLYDLSPVMSVGLRIPYAYANLNATRLQDITFDGSSMALGNPELLGEYRMELSPRLLVPLQAGIGVPVAQGDPDPTGGNRAAQAQTMVNRSMDAGSGWENSELFWVGRLPITLSGALVYRRSGWFAYAKTKLGFAAKIRGEVSAPGAASPTQEGVYSLNALTFRNVTSFGIEGTIYKELFLGANLSFATNIVDELSYDSNTVPPSILSVVAEPHAGYSFGMVKARLGYIAPLSGAIKDIGGLRLRLELAL